MWLLCIKSRGLAEGAGKYNDDISILRVIKV